MSDRDMWVKDEVNECKNFPKIVIDIVQLNRIIVEQPKSGLLFLHEHNEIRRQTNCQIT